MVSNKFTDYLHMIKENDQWKIVDALWDYHIKD
ncbi:MAG: nuclear transport factor 2 family protein [Candidatus Heimdallarchaeota archaeon]